MIFCKDCVHCQDPENTGSMCIVMFNKPKIYTRILSPPCPVRGIQKTISKIVGYADFCLSKNVNFDCLDYKEK